MAADAVSLLACLEKSSSSLDDEVKAHRKVHDMGISRAKHLAKQEKELD